MKKTGFYRVGCALAAIMASALTSANGLPWMNLSLSADQRADLLIQAMSLDDKFQQLVGAPGIVAELPHCAGGRHIPGVPRLAIPTFRITNGPVGVGQNDCVPAETVAKTPSVLMMSPESAKATALPAAIALAATFDREAAARFGDVLGRQSRHLALHVMEAPGINLARMPHGGRNFEYFGEDPYLAGEMAVAQIKAVQDHGVIAMPKHYAVNEQETDRKIMNAIVDTRTLHQLYLLPFEMVVKDAQAASIMCSYNYVNGIQVCEDPYLLNTVLREQWGFKGYVQSDFFAVQSLDALRAGTDHEMPGFRIDKDGYRTWFTPENIKAALEAGGLAQADIDLALRRRYVVMFELGIFDRPLTQKPLDLVGDAAIATEIGEQGAVLLKNTHRLLPIDASAVQRIALIGKSDYAESAVVGGGGSSQVIPFSTVPALEGIRQTLASLNATPEIDLIVVADDNSNLSDAVLAAENADVVIIMAGGLSREGEDLESLHLPKQQDEMIDSIAAVNQRSVLVLKNNAATLMPWRTRVPAILQAWFPGQQDGLIVSRLLFGLSNPSGKLPVSYPADEADLPATKAIQWPGEIQENGLRRVEYSEGLAIGYRWFDAQGIQPLYPFGFGLSYTTFDLGDLSVSPQASDVTTPVTVELTVTNTGDIAGAEVVQVYLSFPTNVKEPPKRLVGFAKVFLEAGQSEHLSIVIDPAAAHHPFGYFNTERQGWETPAGDFQLMVGTSSADIVYEQSIARSASAGD